MRPLAANAPRIRHGDRLMRYAARGSLRDPWISQSMGDDL